MRVEVMSNVLPMASMSWVLVGPAFVALDEGVKMSGVGFCPASLSRFNSTKSSTAGEGDRELGSTSRSVTGGVDERGRFWFGRPSVVFLTIPGSKLRDQRVTVQLRHLDHVCAYSLALDADIVCKRLPVVAARSKE